MGVFLFFDKKEIEVLGEDWIIWVQEENKKKENINQGKNFNFIFIFFISL